MLNAGRLDRRLDLQQRTITRDAAGGEIVSWVALATVWAAKRDITGRDRLRADAKTAESSTAFTIRYRADLAVTDRVVYAGTPHDIQHLAELGHKEGLEILCKLPGDQA